MAKKYAIWATKQDYEEAYEEIRQLETELSKTFDWKKLKRTSLDELKTLIDALKRQKKS